MNYYYTVFGSSDDYYLASYKDIANTPFSQYIYQPLYNSNSFINLCYRAHLNAKINSFIKLPCKQIWNSRLLNNLPTDKKHCFIFFAGTRRFESLNYGFDTYLRKHYPDCKLVCFYQDLVSIKRPVEIDRVKEIFDLVLSFDQDDCKRYGLMYYPLVYSHVLASDTQIENDVYFVGYAKNRIADILSAYEYLRDNGLKCDFHVVGAHLTDQKYGNEIDYCGPISYQRNIEMLKKSKSVIEIMQHGGAGYTLRTCEVIAYKKMLITNNKCITQAPFYDETKIIRYDTPVDIDVQRIKQGMTPCDHHYIDEISPVRLVEHLEERFEKG